MRKTKKNTNKREGVEIMGYDVTFLVLKTGKSVTKKFYSEFLARKFVNKLKRSKECKLLSYPYFKY